VKSLSLPTVERPSDFYLGGLFALVLFALIVMVFYMMLTGLQRIHSYAMKKSASVTVSLVDMNVPTSKVRNTPRVKPVPKVEQPKSKPVPKTPPAPAPDISSLFSEVKTERIVHKKRVKPTPKTIDTKRIASLQTRLKTSKKRKISATAKKVENLSLIKPVRRSGGKAASGGDKVNAYYAKIQATIYAHFYPPANSAGAVARIRITVDASGTMRDYRVLQYSGEPFFDQEVDRLKDRLRQVAFERNPDGRQVVLDVSLISKE